LQTADNPIILLRSALFQNQRGETGMATIGKLAAQTRTELGTLQCNRLRRQGLVPGNLYGHKQQPVSLKVNSDEIDRIVRSGTRVLNLEFDGNIDTAVVREVQWDYLGNQITHIDLVRVDPNERVTVEVHVDLKGIAPGTLSGGILDHSLHHLTVECLAIQIPDSIPVRIGALEAGDAIHVRELEVPENTRILNNPEAIVVRVARPGEEELELGEGGGPVQPEVIGRKATDEAE
jgi:large subunit ribosomal protein L25